MQSLLSWSDLTVLPALVSGYGASVLGRQIQNLGLGSVRIMSYGLQSPSERRNFGGSQLGLGLCMSGPEPPRETKLSSKTLSPEPV